MLIVNDVFVRFTFIKLKYIITTLTVEYPIFRIYIWCSYWLNTKLKSWVEVMQLIFTSGHWEFSIQWSQHLRVVALKRLIKNNLLVAAISVRTDAPIETCVGATLWWRIHKHSCTTFAHGHVRRVHTNQSSFASVNNQRFVLCFQLAGAAAVPTLLVDAFVDGRRHDLHPNCSLHLQQSEKKSESCLLDSLNTSLHGSSLVCI